MPILTALDGLVIFGPFLTLAAILGVFVHLYGGR